MMRRLSVVVAEAALLLGIAMSGGLPGAPVAAAAPNLAEPSVAHASATSQNGPSAYPVTATPTAASRATPRDIPTFVVGAMGDSFGSGEGAPEGPNGKYWQWSTARAGTKDYNDDNQCHRSRWAGSAQAIALLQNTFKGRVNIVFKNFACSGAAIRYSLGAFSGWADAGVSGGGILNPYEGMSPEIVTAKYPVQQPQITQLESWRAGRQIDAVLLNIGGNDSGFGRMLFLCAVAEYALGSDYAFRDCAKRGDQPNSWDISGWAQDVWDGFDGPTTFDSEAREELAIGDDVDADYYCTSLTMQDAAAQRCTPLLDASYKLLAQALRGETARTWLPCSQAESEAAQRQAPASAPIGFEVKLARTSCFKANQTGVLGWAKVGQEYPRISSPNAVKAVYINTYPGPVTDSNGNYCHEGPADDPVFKMLTNEEAEYMDRGFLTKLNGRIAANARVNSTSATPWKVVNVDSGYRHGYCANPQDRWINSNTDALKTVAPMLLPLPFGIDNTLGVGLNILGISSGFAHPNQLGFKQMYRSQIAEQLRTQICAQFRLDLCPKLTDGRPPAIPAIVSGRVTSRAGAALSGVRIDITNDWNDVLFSATTGADGRYSFTGLPPSTRSRPVTFTLKATPTSQSGGSYLPNTVYFEPYDGESKTVDVSLDMGAAVDGTVTTASGSPAGGVKVQLFAPPSYSYAGGVVSQAPVLAAETRTTSDGRWALGGLTAGTYRVRFSSDDTAVPHYRSSWATGKATYSEATAVSLELNRTVSLPPETLVEGPDVGTITGYVFDEDEYVAEDVGVTAYSSAGQPLATTVTDEYGLFELKDVPAGTILLNFTPGSGTNYGYFGLLDQWYSGRRTILSADPIELKPEQTLDLGNLTMLGGSRLEVSVVDDLTGRPVQATVRVTETGGESWSARTRPDGTALFTGLPKGSYTVLVEPSAPYLKEWFDKRSTFAEADTVDLGHADEQSVYFSVQKTPNEIEMETNRADDGTVEITLEGVFGAAQYQIQRQSPVNEKKWTTVYQGAGVAYDDSGAKAAAFEDQACYRARGLSPLGKWGKFGGVSCA